MKISYKISDKTYILKASLYTQIAYKALFRHDLLTDLAKADDIFMNDNADERTDGYLIYLQALYVLADEGTGGLPTFDEWLKSIDGIDMPDVIRTVAALYASTTRADRKNE